MHSLHDIYGFLAFALGTAGTAVYLVSIFKGETKPHIYTHFVWGIVATIAFFAQLQNNGGPGCWAIGVTAASCLFQSALALKYGEKNITSTDKIALVLSLAAVAAWAAVDDKLPSVVLGCIIDVVAFYPTFRKSWEKPWEENLSAYNIANVKMVLALAALDSLKPVNVLYPIAGFSINTIFVLCCLWRRKMMARAAIA